MNNFFIIIASATLTLLSSCQSDQQKINAPKRESTAYPSVEAGTNQTFTVDKEALTKDFATWYQYTYRHVVLSKDFIGLDTKGDTINKKAFLQKLLNRNVAAFKTGTKDKHPVYQLFELTAKDGSIRTTIKQMAFTEMAHFAMEGMDMPDFRFTDLNGNIYDKVSTKGKVVVLKCWFINCVACVKEFPELNKLVMDNQSRKDILFISLALDTKKSLQKFLKQKEFNYAVVPEAEAYMTNQLNVREYPTHFLVDKNGKIVKVVNRIDELTPSLAKQLALMTQ